jgi:lysophospholipase L1-like esterase
MSLAESTADTRPHVSRPHVSRPHVSRPHVTRGNRSPFEAVVTAAIRVASARATPDIRRGNFQEWSNGVVKVCADRAPFAEYWEQRNERALAGSGPLWVALGDSAAQGIGADHPADGYVGQAWARLTEQTGRPWRVVNLSSSGATIPDVLAEQLPRLATLPAAPTLVTCGIGTNDLLRVAPGRVRALYRDLIDAVPANTVLLDVPLPVGRCRIGRFAVRYVARVNAMARSMADARRLPVALVSRHFVPPWSGKFGPDDFHPNATGYQDWARAVLQAVPIHR